MDGEQPSESDVTRYLYGVGVEVLVGGAHLDHLSSNPEPERQHDAGPEQGLTGCLSNPEQDVMMMMMMMKVVVEGQGGGCGP